MRSDPKTQPADSTLEDLHPTEAEAEEEAVENIEEEGEPFNGNFA